MINLFIPYYIDLIPDRQKELFYCLKSNWVNESIGKIYVVSEDPSVKIFSSESGKVEFILISDRPTYSSMFEIINSVTGPNDWNVLINSDIYTDETISLIKKHGDNDFLALSRWDVDKEGSAKHFNTWDSQDSWAFKGKARKMNADFYQGTAGCDNAIANRAEIAGYRVLNPSKTIKTYHLHNSGIRNYNPNNKVEKPYKLITPHE